MRLYGINVGDLFRRSTELPTASAIKARSWTPIKYIKLLNALSKFQKNQLHQDTIKALQSPIRSFSSVLDRQVCFDLLEKLGSLDKNDLSNVYIYNGEVERGLSAVHYDVRSMDNDKAQVLLNFGGQRELMGIIMAGWKPSEKIWNQLLQSLISNRQFESAKKLWDIRPVKNGVKAMGTYKTMTEFLNLAGEFEDIVTVKDLSEHLSTIEATRRTAAAGLNASSKIGVKHLLETLPKIANHIKVSDAKVAGDTLAKKILDVFPQLPLSPTPLTCNVLLQGIYQQYSSQAVLHTFRTLVNEKNFKGNEETAQILANSAYRLGNSKSLAFYIWKEHILENEVTPTRKFMETILLCQMVGLSYHTVFYFLQEMRKRGIYLRQHIQRQLVNKFEAISDSSLIEMFQDMTKLQKVQNFDLQLAKHESGESWKQAEANAKTYLVGRGNGLESLSRMIEFEMQRKELSHLS